jgi:hypothetical protein
MFIQIVRIASAAAAQQVLGAHARFRCLRDLKEPVAARPGGGVSKVSKHRLKFTGR